MDLHWLYQLLVRINSTVPEMEEQFFLQLIRDTTECLKHIFHCNISGTLFTPVMILNHVKLGSTVSVTKVLPGVVFSIFYQKPQFNIKKAFPSLNSLNLPELLVNELKKTTSKLFPNIYFSVRYSTA